MRYDIMILNELRGVMIMRIAALGDIHSNHFALEACMDWIYKNDIDGIAFLGDYVSDCPYPQKTMQIIRNIPCEYKTWFVRGNREDYMLFHKRNLTESWQYNSQSGSLLYTYENLSDSDLRFFEAMPIGMEVKLDGYPPFSICHGSMQSSCELFYDNSPEIKSIAREMTTKLLICAHCHKQYIYTKGAKTILNAGTVGVPSHGDTDAQMAIIESNGGEWSVQTVAVPYDREAVINEFYESGLIKKANVWSRTIIAVIKTGRHYNSECVQLVKRLCKELGREFSDEEIWQMVASELDI